MAFYTCFLYNPNQKHPMSVCVRSKENTVMSLFSKIFGENKDARSVLENFAKSVKEELESENRPAASSAQASGPAPHQGQVIPSSEPAPAQSAPFGVSWGKEMPAEPNQFNYPGTYTQYFEEIFREEFPDYLVRKDIPNVKNAVVYTFVQGEKRALVVELLPSRSESRRLRNECRRAGVPYLRYYIDHEGWWNTRAYVTQRTRSALNG